MASLLQGLLLILALLNIALLARFYKRCFKDTISYGKGLLQTRLDNVPLSLKRTISGGSSSTADSDLIRNLEDLGLQGGIRSMKQGFTSAINVDPFSIFDKLSDVERIQFKGALILQQFFYEKQIAQCRRHNEGVALYRLPYTHKYGLFSQVFGLAHSLLDATGHDHVLSWKNTVTFYADPSRCPSRSFECLFKPITTCDDDSRPNIIRDDVRSFCVYEYPRRRLHELLFKPNVSDWQDMLPILRSKTGLDQLGYPDLFNAQFFLREALRFATRPNQDLIDLTKNLLETHLKPINGWTPLGPSVRRIAVHVRAGDDKKGHTGVLDAKFYLKLVQRIGSRSLKQIVFSSDDAKSQELFLAEVKSGSCIDQIPPVALIPPQLFGSMASVVDSKTVVSGGKESSNSTRFDTGMLLMAQVYIFSAADAVVGLFASNVALAMSLYMSSLRYTSHVPTYDTGGSPWPVCNQFDEYPLRFMRHPSFYGIK